MYMRFWSFFVVMLLGIPSLVAQDMPFTMTADTLEYSADNTIATAEGNVEVLSEDAALWADKITYNTKTSQVIAEGDITLVEKGGGTLFMDKVELTDQMKYGVIENISMRLGLNGPAVRADKVEKSDRDHIVMKDVLYSPCKPCNEKGLMPWQVKAGEVTYDREDKDLTYKNARLHAYGVPVLYLPYFKHPVGQKKAVSGLLPPRFGRSTARGEEVTMAYYHRASDYEDYTTRARWMSQRGTQLHLERRYAGTNMYSELRGSLIDDDKTGSVRSHIETVTEYTFEPGTRMGLNGAMASDDTYMDDLLGRTPSYLPSTFYAEKAGDDFYLSGYGRWYQDLREGQDPAQTAQILPRLQAEKVFTTNRTGEQIKLYGDMLSLVRSEGIQSRRLVTNVVYERPMLFKDGSRLDMKGQLRTDVYQVDGNTTERDGFTARVAPTGSITWQKPYISPGGNHKITPKAMVILSPRGNNPETIPNEDSVAYELDSTNLFTNNRFAGFDRIETGHRFVYGVDNYWGKANRTRWHVFFGQSYRMFDDNTLPAQGGTQTQLSDWVGSITARPAEWFTINNKFRLDNADFEARRSDTSVTLGKRLADGGTYLSFSHSFLDGGPRELFADARYELNNQLALEGRMRRDLTDDGKLLLGEVGVVYTHNCYEFSFITKRRGFDNQNVPPSTDYVFNIELLTWGSDNDHRGF